jgi:O-antigen/teichoic acid export membrane protein
MQVAAAIVVSHLVAERRYGWAWERRYAHRMFSFGWPLLINGLLLYGIMHGDRVIIGSAKQLFPHAIYTLKNLGEYSIAFSVMMAPAVFVGNVTTSLFLPVLSRARAFPLDFQRSYHRIFALICLIAGLITIPCIVAGPKLLVWIYGPKYSAAGGLVGIFAAMWGLRIIRYVPSVAALSSGDTRSPMVSNLVRSLTFVVSIYAAAAGQPLVWIAVAGLLGDFLALPTLMWQVSHRHGADSRPCLMPLAVIGAGASISFLLAHFSQTDALASVVFLKTLSTTGITAGLLIALTPPLRADLQSATLAVSNFFRTELISSRARPEHITASNPE